MRTRRHRAIRWAETGRKRKETIGIMFHTDIAKNTKIKRLNANTDITNFNEKLTAWARKVIRISKLFKGVPSITRK